MRLKRSPELAHRRAVLTALTLFMSLFVMGWGLAWWRPAGDDSALWAWASSRWQAGLDASWCGRILLGYPLADSGPMNLLYPPVRLLAWLWPEGLAQAFNGLHLAALGLGVYFLAREFGVRNRGALGAGLLAAATAPHSAGGTLIGGAAWLPWALLGLRRCILLPRGPRGLASAGLAGLALGLLLSAGHLGLSLAALGVGAVGLLVWAGGERPAQAITEKGLLGRLLLLALLAALIASGRLAGLVRFQRQSTPVEPAPAALSALPVPAPAQAPFSAAMSDSTAPAAPARVLGYGESALLRTAGQDLDAQLQALLSDNRGLVWGVDNARGRVGQGLARSSPFPLALDDRSPSADPAAKALGSWGYWMDRASVRWLVSAEPLQLAGLRLVRHEGVYLYERPQAMPLVRYAARIGVVGSAAAAARSAARLPPQVSDLLEADAAPVPAAAEPGDRLQLMSRDDAEWRLRCGIPGPRLLVLSLAYYQGAWAAEVDGQAWALLPVDGQLCGLALPAGEHHVTVRYFDPYAEPGGQAQRLGLWLVLPLFLLPWAQRWKRRKARG